MAPETTTAAVPASVARAVRTITGAQNHYDALLDLVDDRRFVLIGEASHGMQEFYGERARITRRLVDEHGFIAVASRRERDPHRLLPLSC